MRPDLTGGDGFTVHEPKSEDRRPRRQATTSTTNDPSTMHRIRSSSPLNLCRYAALHQTRQAAASPRSQPRKATHQAPPLQALAQALADATAAAGGGPAEHHAALARPHPAGPRSPAPPLRRRARLCNERRRASEIACTAIEAHHTDPLRPLGASGSWREGSLPGGHGNTGGCGWLPPAPSGLLRPLSAVSRARRRTSSSAPRPGAIGPHQQR
jgi:hypothetical protein